MLLIVLYMQTAKVQPTSGTYYIAAAGDYIGGNQVINRIGKGRFSMVWKASLHDQQIAIKIYRTGGSFIKYYANEIRIYNKLYNNTSSGGPQNIVKYLNTFVHINMDSNGYPKLYPCIVLAYSGPSLDKLVNYCIRTYNRGVPIIIAKKLMKDIFNGLSYLHDADIIHTDITPGNILLTCEISENMDNIGACIADLGSSSTSDNIFSKYVGTTQYMAPELVVEASYDSAADIWSACTIYYELITGDLLFDVFGDCDFRYGSDVDTDVSCEDPPADATTDAFTDIPTDAPRDAVDIEGTSTDSSSISSGEEEENNYRHLLLMAKLLGYPPAAFAQSARKYYNRRNKLKNNPDINIISISLLMHANYDIDMELCKCIESFLLDGLKYIAAERMTAKDAYMHGHLCI